MQIKWNSLGGDNIFTTLELCGRCNDAAEKTEKRAKQAAEQAYEKARGIKFDYFYLSRFDVIVNQPISFDSYNSVFASVTAQWTRPNAFYNRDWDLIFLGDRHAAKTSICPYLFMYYRASNKKYLDIDANGCRETLDGFDLNPHLHSSQEKSRIYKKVGVSGADGGVPTANWLLFMESKGVRMDLTDKHGLLAAILKNRGRLAGLGQSRWKWSME